MDTREPLPGPHDFMTSDGLIKDRALSYHGLCEGRVLMESSLNCVNHACFRDSITSLAVCPPVAILL